MGIYLNNEVINKISDTNQIINRDCDNALSNIKKTPGEDLSGEELLYDVLNSAWTEFFRLIKSNPSKIDKYTPFNQEHMVHNMEFTIDEYKENKAIFLSNLLRIMFEYYFWTGDRGERHYLSAEILTELEEQFKEYEPYIQFMWIRDSLHVALTKWLINSDEFSKAKNLVAEINQKRDQLVKDISQQSGIIINEIENEKASSLKVIADTFSNTQNDIQQAKEEATNNLNYIKSTLDEVNALENRIQNVRSEYNFVGLSSGFNKIKEKKEKELNTTQKNYRALFRSAFIAPLVAVGIHLAFPNTYPKDFSVAFLILPFFTIEMILIYFFRLSYLEAKSLRTQLVQIELRLSLCAFIDQYVEYRKKNETKIEKVLEMFDSLIFSPIQTNENNIPAMFDGIEALAGLADKVIKN